MNQTFEVGDLLRFTSKVKGKEHLYCIVLQVIESGLEVSWIKSHSGHGLIQKVGVPSIFGTYEKVG